MASAAAAVRGDCWNNPGDERGGASVASAEGSSEEGDDDDTDGGGAERDAESSAISTDPRVHGRSRVTAITSSAEGVIRDSGRRAAWQDSSCVEPMPSGARPSEGVPVSGELVQKLSVFARVRRADQIDFGFAVIHTSSPRYICSCESA